MSYNETGSLKKIDPKKVQQLTEKGFYGARYL